MLRSSCSRSQGQSRRRRRVIASSSSSASRSRSASAWRHRGQPPPCWAPAAALRRHLRRRAALRRPGIAPGGTPAGAPAGALLRRAAEGERQPAAPGAALEATEARRRGRALRSSRSRCRRRCRRREVLPVPSSAGGAAPVAPGTGFFWPGRHRRRAWSAPARGRCGSRRSRSPSAQSVLRAPVVAEVGRELVELLLLLLRDEQLPDALLGLLEALLAWPS